MVVDLALRSFRPRLAESLDLVEVHGVSVGHNQAVRAGIIYQARLHYEKDGQREFVHSETGVRTLKDEFDKVAGHNQHHLQQIERALKQSGGR